MVMWCERRRVRVEMSTSVGGDRRSLGCRLGINANSAFGLLLDDFLPISKTSGRNRVNGHELRRLTGQLQLKSAAENVLPKEVPLPRVTTQSASTDTPSTASSSPSERTARSNPHRNFHQKV
ncbi:spore coat protein U [Striga asiatica]|uniref:Spore coat protein U n=1 Tax=Striga asiatica TaxID=4170 RepID=A0A5A7Q242_STRAF|nr:spore coat protein U [Striga asiatica]